MLIKTKAIVIRTRDYGESNKIITLFSAEMGKISIMVRGARKPKSRLSSISQLFTYGHYLLYRGSPSSMGTLSQGEMINSFWEIRSDLALTAYAAYFTELVDRLLDDGERHPYLFKMLLTIFDHLLEGKDPEILARLFEIKVLIIAGYKPEIDKCVQCGVTEGSFGFSIKEGGFLCQHCLDADPQMLRLTTNTIKLLRLLYYFDIQRLGEISVKDETKQELRKTLWMFMDHHTPLRLKSRSFLEQMSTFL